MQKGGGDKSEVVISCSNKYLAPTYARQPVVLVRGEGCRVWDKNGKEYLDFVAGIAVCILGHAHPAITKSIREQAKKLLHVSNLYHIEPQAELAKLLVKNSFADSVFFCNSGAEANEAAIKLARKYSSERFGRDRHRIIAMVNSFHGRTIATLSATGQEKFRKGFAPLLDGFDFVRFNDIDSLCEKIDTRTCAVMLETIQCEGGVHVADRKYLRAVREICDEKKLLLIIDEVQTGMGRTGRLFSYEHYDIEPDIMTLAKGLGNGVPIGAMLAKREVINIFTPGSHASTFGGNPLATSAGLATMRTLLSGKIIDNCVKSGNYLRGELDNFRKRFPFIKDVRGRGLIQGLELELPCGEIVNEARVNGLLVNSAADNVLRLSPPLIVTKKEIEHALSVLEKIFSRRTSKKM